MGRCSRCRCSDAAESAAYGVLAAAAAAAAAWLFAAQPALPEQVQSLGFGLTVAAVVAVVLSAKAWAPAALACCAVRAAGAAPVAAAPVVAWHTLPLPQLHAALGLPPPAGAADEAAGLTAAAAAQALARGGANVLPPRPRPSVVLYLLKEVHEPQQKLLLAVAVAYALIGQVDEAAFALAVIAAMIAAEAVTELRAKAAVAALATAAPATAYVVRDGREVAVDRATVVPGDVVVLRRGNDVPADARLLSAHGLAVDESAFTGETAGRFKAPAPGGGDAADVMVLRGTRVVAGRGTARVVATGVATMEGRLHADVAAAAGKAGKTPLQGLLRSLAGYLTVVALVASVGGGALGAAHRAPWQDIVLTALSLAFATIPEELPILVAAVLAVGGARLGSLGVYVKRLKALESLAYVDTVVADKTGTLTANALALVATWTPPPTAATAAVAAGWGGGPTPHAASPALLAAWVATAVDLPAAGSSATFTPADAMDVAVAAALASAGGSGGAAAVTAAAAATRALEALARVATVVDEVPFSAVTKTSSRTLQWASPPATLRLTRGAPEVLLPRCGATPAAARAAAADALRLQGGSGRRVIALMVEAVADTPPPPAPPLDGRGAGTLLGLMAFDDPVAHGVPAALAQLAGAGITVVMCTGDAVDTGAAVAARLHLRDAADGGVVDCAHLRDDDAAAVGASLEAAAAARVRVFARATPAHKLALVLALQRRGATVAVTGDGTNDAPALAAADIGVAVAGATDVARDAAALVVVAGDFGALVTAVAEGRRLLDNLMAALAFYLGCKAALVALFIAGTAWRGFPLAAVQVIFVELFMDVAASTAFVAERAAPHVLARPPRRRADPPFAPSFWVAIAATAASMAAAVLGSYAALVVACDAPAAAPTAAFYAWMVGHVLVAHGLRAAPTSLNAAMAVWLAAVAVVVLVLAFVPPLGGALGLVALSPLQWGVVLAITVPATTWLAPAGAVAAWCARRAAARHVDDASATAPLLP